MGLLMLPAIDIRYQPHELINCDDMHVSLQMQTKVFTLKAKKLTTLYYDTYLLRKPFGSSPELAGLGTFQGSIDNENRGNTIHCFSGGELLVSAASVTPAACLSLPFDTCFEHLRESWQSVSYSVSDSL